MKNKAAAAHAAANLTILFLFPPISLEPRDPSRARGGPAGPAPRVAGEGAVGVEGANTSVLVGVFALFLRLRRRRAESRPYLALRAPCRRRIGATLRLGAGGGMGCAGGSGILE